MSEDTLQEIRSLHAQLVDAIRERDVIGDECERQMDYGIRQHEIAQQAMRDRDDAICERKACHEIYDQVLELFGYTKGQGYPGLLGAAQKMQAEAAKAAQESTVWHDMWLKGKEELEAIKSGLANFRDAVLNDRDHLEEGTLNTDQTNAVLRQFDSDINLVAIKEERV